MPEGNTKDNDNVDNSDKGAQQLEIPKELLDAAIEKALAPMKDKLDAAYASRDEALEKVAAHDQTAEETRIKRLEEDGKHKEAWDAKEAQLNAENKALQTRNVELTRDIDVRGSLSGLEFRHDRASQMAFKEISEGLIRNENGAWATKDGKTVSDAVKAFAEDESNSFLFRPKENNGGGTPPPSGSPKESPKSVFESSQEDVLAAAAERLGGS